MWSPGTILRRAGALAPRAKMPRAASSSWRISSTLRSPWARTGEIQYEREPSFQSIGNQLPHSLNARINDVDEDIEYFPSSRGNRLRCSLESPSSDRPVVGAAQGYALRPGTTKLPPSRQDRLQALRPRGCR